MILDRPPPEWKRPNMPSRVKLDVVIRQEGKCKETGEKLGTLDNTQFDHRPPLSERQFDTEAWDTIPPANDAAFIEAVTISGHDKRTNGPGGEKRITTAGSDANVRAKRDRIAETEAKHRDAMNAKGSGEPTVTRPRRKWASRPMPSRPFPKKPGIKTRMNRKQGGQRNG